MKYCSCKYSDPANRTIKCSVIPAGKQRLPALIDSFSTVFFSVFAPFFCSSKMSSHFPLSSYGKSSMNMRDKLILKKITERLIIMITDLPIKGRLKSFTILSEQIENDLNVNSIK